ncbi:MAG: glycerol-3-phosphate 1-O-acyltransferase PlsY [Phycisphaerales bacterium JB037]
MLWTIAIAVSFLSGSVPYGLLLARWFAGIDIREHGSGNIGATNVGRVLGARLGLVCFTLDVLKGFVPTIGFGLAAGVVGTLSIPPTDAWLWLATMAAAVLGHLFCPWIGFRGGKGVATGLGALLGVYPALSLSALVALGVWIVTLRLWKFVGVSSTLAAISLPISVAVIFLLRDAWNSATPFLVVTLALAALVVFKHRGNLRRTLAGTEPKFGDRARSATVDQPAS